MTQEISPGFNPDVSSSYVDSGDGALPKLNALISQQVRERELRKVEAGLLRAKLPSTMWVQRVETEQYLSKAVNEIEKLDKLIANLEALRGYTLTLKAIYEKDLAKFAQDSTQWRAAKVWLAKCG